MNIIEIEDDSINKVKIDGLAILLLDHKKQMDINHPTWTLADLISFGISWSEALAILEDRPFNEDDKDTESKTKVMSLIVAHRREQIKLEELRIIKQNERTHQAQL